MTYTIRLELEVEADDPEHAEATFRRMFKDLDPFVVEIIQGGEVMLMSAAPTFAKKEEQKRR